MNSPWPELAQVGPLLEESARARLRWRVCTEAPDSLDNSLRTPSHYSSSH
jgi:hypothetical protein